MVMTILEASVESGQWQALEEAFHSAIQNLEPGIAQTMLVQQKKDQNLWRIITLWESQAALDSMRQAVEVPRGILIFHSVGVQPTLSVFEIHEQAGR